MFYAITMIVLLACLYMMLSLYQEHEMDIIFLLISGFLLLYGVLLTAGFIKSQKKQAWHKSSKVLYNVLLGLITICTLKLNHHFLTDDQWSLGLLV